MRGPREILVPNRSSDITCECGLYHLEYFPCLRATLAHFKTIMEHPSAIAIFTFVWALLLAWYIIRCRHRTRLAKLGDTPRNVPYWIHFGFDTLYEVVKYN